MNEFPYQSIPRDFFLQKTVLLAPQLLGKYLIRTIASDTLIGRIVESEAYTQNDPASHSFKGITARCAPMFETGGISYVYFIYGMYYCFNIVTEKAGVGSAILIRAVEPVNGIDVMKKNRAKGKNLTNGPGKVCMAFGINKNDSGKDLSIADIQICKNLQKEEEFDIIETTRIGIKEKERRPYRFYIKNNLYVSAK